MASEHAQDGVSKSFGGRVANDPSARIDDQLGGKVVRRRRRHHRDSAREGFKDGDPEALALGREHKDPRSLQERVEAGLIHDVCPKVHRVRNAELDRAGLQGCPFGPVADYTAGDRLPLRPQLCNCLK
jgi:hypothetical protein